MSQIHGKVDTVNSESSSQDKAIRKVQAFTGERSLTIVLPKSYTEALQIHKGDFLTVKLDGDKLVLQKAIL